MVTPFDLLSSSSAVWRYIAPNPASKHRKFLNYVCIYGGEEEGEAV
jgi:D-alanyl-D-alanine dipeptidase